MARVTVMLLAAAVFCGSYGLTAPASGRLNNPPQNPVFLLAGP